MRGAKQFGHSAVVVWSQTFEQHIEDVNAQLARGCTERPRGSFQLGADGLYFSWLSLPADQCGLCSGPCRHRR
jgi:hypothetical protein